MPKWAFQKVVNHAQTRTTCSCKYDVIFLHGENRDRRKTIPFFGCYAVAVLTLDLADSEMATE